VEVVMRMVPLVALVGCRFGFDLVQRSDDAAVDALDVPAAVCGDNVCSGNAGENCTTCADCVTLTPVCGNSVCDPGEATTCYTDCGPLPWAWPGDADEMLIAVNQARTSGTTCPGGGGQQTAPALTADTTLEVTAREWAWETAHLGWTMSASCNGRSGNDRVTDAGASTAWKVFNATSPTTAITYLLGSKDSCNAIMSASNTRLGAAGAHDLLDAEAIVLR
jgi:uncharacterized protein YkwD